MVCYVTLKNTPFNKTVKTVSRYFKGTTTKKHTPWTQISIIFATKMFWKWSEKHLQVWMLFWGNCWPQCPHKRITLNLSKNLKKGLFLTRKSSSRLVAFFLESWSSSVFDLAFTYGHRLYEIGLSFVFGSLLADWKAPYVPFRASAKAKKTTRFR